jgi:Ca2+-binding EF-hand superfamily protein
MVDSAPDYTIPFQYRKVFTPEDCSQIVQTFKNYDKNHNKQIEAKEFGKMMKDMGYGVLTQEQQDAIFKKYDRN